MKSSSDEAANPSAAFHFALAVAVSILTMSVTTATHRLAYGYSSAWFALRLPVYLVPITYAYLQVWRLAYPSTFTPETFRKLWWSAFAPLCLLRALGDPARAEQADGR